MRHLLTNWYNTRYEFFYGGSMVFTVPGAVVASQQVIVSGGEGQLFGALLLMLCLLLLKELATAGDRSSRLRGAVDMVVLPFALVTISNLAYRFIAQGL